MAVVVFLISGVALIFVSLLFRAAYDTLSCYLLTQRRIKKIVERQDMHGPKPRPLTGSMEMAALIPQSTSKDFEHIHHDIVSRLLLHYVTWSQQYGKRFIYCNGIEPRICLSETDLIKELLTKFSMKAGNRGCNNKAQSILLVKVC